MFNNILYFRPRSHPDFYKNPKELMGFNVAILATNGFEQSQIFDPKEALEDAGARVEIISPISGKIKGWHHSDWGRSVSVNRTIDEVSVDEFDALMIPGGVFNTDLLRMSHHALHFVRVFLKSKKPVAAISHGPQILIDTKMLKGRDLTSWPSIRTDLLNAGAKWTDQPVVIGNGLITSRKNSDLPEFNAAMIKAFVESRNRSSLPNVEGYAVTL